MVENLAPFVGCDAVLRGEPVKVAHVERVPAHRDLFGSRVRPSWRAVVVYEDGRWNDHVDLHALEPVSALG